MKKIFITLIILSFLFIYLFTLGVFHPKEIYVDNSRIEAPKGMALGIVIVDYKKVTQDRMSLLRLEKNNKYSSKDFEDISIEFFVPGEYESKEYMNIEINTEVPPERYIGHLQKEYTFEKKNIGECHVYSRTGEGFVQVIAVPTEKKMFIRILSSSMASADKVCNQFCAKKKGIRDIPEKQINRESKAGGK